MTKTRKHVGFTMAEILLSLTIIGVVAAITLPSLTGNINERTWNTQRKALYARMSQAIALMPAVNGYGTLEGNFGVDNEGNGTQTVTKDNAAETFVTAGLSKVLKINNICDNQNLQDCGIAASFTDFKNSKVFMPKSLLEWNQAFCSIGTNSNGCAHSFTALDTKAAAFETQNGESIAVFYYPKCAYPVNQGAVGANEWHYVQSIMCANFIYDLNGAKGPNTVGKDIGFISALYPTDTVVVSINPVGPSAIVEQTKIGAECSALNSESRAANADELAAMYFNKRYLLPEVFGDVDWTFWSSTATSATRAWMISSLGYRENYIKTTPLRAFCIKR